MKNIFTVLIFFSFLISSQAKTVQDEINTLKRKFNSEKIFEKKVDYACKISYIYLRIEPEEAKKYAEKLLQISKSEKSNKGEILGCFYLGQYYISITDYAQVHELAYKINDLGKKDNTSLAAACSASLNLVSFTRMKKIPEAKSYYETYKYFKEDKNFPPLVNILLLKSVALYLSAINEHDASYALYEKAYAIAKENEDNTEMSILKNNLGNRYLNMNMPKKAIPLLRESYNLASSIKSFKNMAYAIGSLGEAHMQLKQYDSALFYMHQSLSISNKLKINDLRMSYYEYLSNVYFEQNDYKNAYLYNRAYVQLKDSISNETTNLKISRIENRLALEKKDLQLSLIKSEKSEHQRQRNIMIVVALIAALLFVFSIIGFIRSKRANAKVKAQNKEIEIQSAILEKSRKNLFLLNEIAKKITSTTDLSKITTLVYESINQLMDATGFGFCILDNERGEIIYPYYIERGRVLYEEYRIPLSDDKKLGVICVTKKMNIIINDNAVDRVNYTDSNVVIHGDVPESLIYFPLIVNEECIGAITVQSFSKNAYNTEDIDLLKNIALNAAVGIQNALNFGKVMNYSNELEAKVNERTSEIVAQVEKTESAYKKIQLLSMIGRTISSSLDLQEITKIVYQNINELMSADILGVGIYNGELRRIEMRGLIENAKQIESVYYNIDSDDTFAVWCFKNKSMVVINDLDKDYSKYIHTTPEIKFGSKPMSLIFLPLFEGNDVAGMLTVQCYKPNAYSKEEIELLKNLVIYLESAVKNAATFAKIEDQKLQIEKNASNLQLLTEIGQELSSKLSIEEINNFVYKKIQPLIEVDAFGIGIYRRDHNDLFFPGVMERGKQLETFYTPLSKRRIGSFCFNQQKMIFSNNWREDKQHIPDIDLVIDQGDVPESLMYIPVSSSNDRIGVLTVQSFKKNAFTDSDASFLTSLALNIGNAIENANLYKNLEVKVEERTAEISRAYQNTKILSKITQDILSSLTVEEIIARAYSNVTSIMDATVFGIGIYDEAKQSILFPQLIENGEALRDFVMYMEEDRFAVWSVKNKKEIIIQDYVLEHGQYLKKALEAKAGSDTESIIYFPLFDKDKVLGVITVQSFKKHAFNQYQVDVFRNIGLSTSAALINANSYKEVELSKNSLEATVAKRTEEIEKGRRNLEFLFMLGQKVSATRDIAEINRTVYNSINNVLDAAVFAVGVVNGDKIEFNGAMEKGEELPFHIESLNEERFSSWSVINKKPIFVNDLAKEFKNYFNHAPAPVTGENTASVVFYPLIFEREVIGIFTVQSFKINAYTEDDFKLLESIASYLTISVQNYLAFKQIQLQMKDLERSSENIKLLNEIGKKITSSLDVTTIAQVAYDSINQLMDANVFGIGIVQVESNSISMEGTIENGVPVGSFFYDLGETNRYGVWCYHNKAEVVIGDLSKEYAKYVSVNLAAKSGDDVNSLIYLPLIDESECIGVLTVQSFEYNAYSENHLTILRNLSLYVVTAIKNAKTYRQIEAQKTEIENYSKNLEVIVSDRTNEIKIAYKNIEELSKIGKEITSQLRIPDIIKTTYTKINNLIDASIFAIGLVREDKELIEFDGIIEEGNEMPYAVNYFNENRLSVICYQRKEPLVINTIDEKLRTLGKNSHRPVVGKEAESILYIPLMDQNNKCIAVLTVQSFKGNAYTDYHVDLVRNIGNYTSIAIQNGRLYAQITDGFEKLKATQTQLVEQEKMASLGQLTAGIAHEINNPINYVSAGIDSLKTCYDELLELLNEYIGINPDNFNTDRFNKIEKLKKELDVNALIEESNTLLKSIKTGANRTKEIVKSLRTFSRLDENAFKSVNIEEGLESTLIILQNQIKNRIEVVKEFGNIREVNCLPGPINQVFLNIINNGAQAIPGEGKIWLKTYEESGFACISIKDSGSGMPDEVKKRIFEPFFTTKDVGSGTGLGLSITFGIIEKHNGKIEVESVLGEGTEFIIKLPINN